MARPTKFDQTTAAVILKAVADGLPNETAARLAGIAERTLYHWLRRGRAGEEPFFQFFHELKKQQAQAVSDAVGVIRAAAKRGQWKAAAWWLERRHPDLYGSDRKRVRELERLVSEITRQRADRPARGRPPEGERR